MFAFAPMADAQTDSSFTCSDDGSITYDLSHHCTIAADGTASVVFYWGLGFEEVAAATSAKEMLRQTFDVELTKTRTWLQERRVTFNGDAKLTQLYNTNLFFCMFFSTGITLDTEELVLVTSRSPRYYVSAAYWDRDSLLWSFPAILDADPERAKEMLSYVFGRQRRNFGIHSRYIDGTVLEPGFELDELVAPLLALERYINKTGDKSILSDPDIVQGISPVSYTHLDVYKRQLIHRDLPEHQMKSCLMQLFNHFLWVRPIGAFRIVKVTYCKRPPVRFFLIFGTIKNVKGCFIAPCFKNQHGSRELILLQKFNLLFRFLLRIPMVCRDPRPEDPVRRKNRRPGQRHIFRN